MKDAGLPGRDASACGTMSSKMTLGYREVRPCGFKESGIWGIVGHHWDEGVRFGAYGFRDLPHQLRKLQWIDWRFPVPGHKAVLRHRFSGFYQAPSGRFIGCIHDSLWIIAYITGSR